VSENVQDVQDVQDVQSAEDAELDEAQLIAEELSEVEAATADVLAGIVGDEFGLEMISPWGDRWIWVKINAEQAQEIYKLLGDPVTFQRTGEDAASADEDVVNGEIVGEGGVDEVNEDAEQV
jgi:hypothetical protein